MTDKTSTQQTPFTITQQAALDAFYAESGAESTEEKIAAHEGLSDGGSVSSATGPITREQVLAVHELTFLDDRGLIHLRSF